MQEQFIFIGQLVLAAILGGVIGFEREVQNKEAGIRTHALLSFGSALFTLISLYALRDIAGGYANMDPSRIMGEIVSGLGFLGAGIIIFKQDRVHGLTTAAGLWTCAAIGMAVAVSWYLIAIVGTLILVFILHIIGRIFAFTPEDEGKETFGKHNKQS